MIGIVLLALAAVSGSAFGQICSDCGDVNGDGIVDIIDAMQIGQQTVGRIGRIS